MSLLGLKIEELDGFFTTVESGSPNILIILGGLRIVSLELGHCITSKTV
jgi:hypothetical protein